MTNLSPTHAILGGIVLAAAKRTVIRSGVCLALFWLGSLAGASGLNGQEANQQRIRRTPPVIPAEPLRYSATELPVPDSAKFGAPPPDQASSADQLNGNNLEYQFEDDFAEQDPTKGDQTRYPSPPRQSSAVVQPPRAWRGRNPNRRRRLRNVVIATLGLPTIAGQLDKKGGCWDIATWCAWGVYGNSHGLNGNPGNVPLRFNNVANELLLHQLWFHAQRTPDYNARGFGWGMGVDVLFGADGRDAQVGATTLQLTQDDGWDSTWDTSSRYGFAVPQLYIEGAWRCWSLSLGHFMAGLGFERIEAPRNFFYSHSYAFSYNQPLTYWGFQIRKQWTPLLSTYTARTTGWDTSVENDNDGDATIFGVDYSPAERLHLHAGFSWNDPGDVDTGETDVYFHNFYMQLGVTPTIDWVLAHNFQTRTRPVGVSPIRAFKQYGITNYLFWNLTEVMALGTRYEWFYAGEGAGAPLSPQAITPGSHIHAVTCGMNLRLRPRIIMRPEIRYDWVDFDGAAVGGPFDLEMRRSQFTYGVQSVFVW